MSVDVQALREAYERDRERYGRLAEFIGERLTEETRRAGIRCLISHRVKDLDSFVKKAIRKGYANPVREIRDRAGARVVVAYEHHVQLVAQLVRSVFDIIDEEDKHETLGANELGYLGHHFEVRLRSNSVAESADLLGLVCEIQIHTRLQNAWAEVSHELIYKSRPTPPRRIERRILRLQTLVELFDEEVSRARQEILKLPEKNAARLLDAVDQHFYRLAGHDYDAELSLQIMSTLARLFEEDELSRIGDVVGTFVDQHGDKLRRLYDRHRDVRGVDELLLFQPEALLVFDRIEKDPFVLEEEWSKHHPTALLEQLALLWGKPYQSVA